MDCEHSVSQQCSEAPDTGTIKYPTQVSVEPAEDDPVVPMDTATGSFRPTQESSRRFKARLVPSVLPRYKPLTSYTTNQSLISREGISDYESLVKEEGILHYDIHCSPVGYAALFCNDITSPHDTGPLPVYTDLGLMSRALHKCEWSVQKFPPVPSMSLDDCKERLKAITGRNYNGYSCFMFYYSGHGTSKGLLLSDGCRMPYVDIVHDITSINSLARKPKIFIFDCCREVSKKSGILKNLFRKTDDETDTKNYVPADSLICFATSEGTESFSGDDIGSFFTAELTKKLKMFWNKLTFTEIVTLAHGCTTQLARRESIEQQPVMYNGLNRLLLFGAGSVFQDEKPQSSYSQRSVNVIKSKGPDCQEKPSELASDVETDAIGKRIAFKTEKDVTNNLPRLGREVSVFVCYTPDPESPYHDPKDREEVIVHNQRQIVNLIRDLERHGFTVISDLHLGSTQPRNWLQWYVSRIELCDYLIMVCSPALKELFSCGEPKHRIIDERSSWFRTYCTSIYAEIHKEGKESAISSKFVPVILDGCAPDDCIPTLLATGSKYELLDQTVPRKFEYGDRDGVWENLVCRMAGIDRNKLSAQSVDEGVHKLAAPYSKSQVRGCVSTPVISATKSLPAEPKKKRGHVVVPWVPPTNQQAPPPAKRVVSSNHSLPSTATSQASHPTLLPHHPPSSQPVPPSQPPQPAELPNTPPAHSTILWLCDKITEWKFFARYLKMENSEIERILIDYRDNVMEQRYQMFESWKKHEWSDYTYRTLGDVLLKSESNRQLYADFCNEVMQAE